MGRLVAISSIVLLGASAGFGCGDGRLDDLPDYSVHNRLPDVGGDVADLLVPSLFREHERREEICRAIAAEQELETAFFFSSDAALSAHQAQLPSPDDLLALQTGFLGELRDDLFTPGEEVYPAVREAP